MATPAVSICVLAYNRPEGLRRTLAYWQAQTFTDWELLIGDDASTDLAVEKVGRAAAESDPRIRYIRHASNQGIIGNHRFLLAEARGTYLVWACDDDHWHPGYLEAAVEVLEHAPEVVMVCGQAQLLTLEGLSLPQPCHLETRGMPGQKRLVRVATRTIWWNHAWYGLFRRAALESLDWSPQFAFDVLAVAKLSLRGPIAVLPEGYFCKQAGEVGNHLADNLAAVRIAPHGLLRFWPAAVVFANLLNLLWRRSPADLLANLWASIGLLPVLFSFPFGRPRWFRRGRLGLRQVTTYLGHTFWRGYARWRFRDPLRATLLQFPWVKPAWLAETDSGAELKALGLKVDLPRHGFAFSHYFALRELVVQGGALSRTAPGELVLPKLNSYLFKLALFPRYCVKKSSHSSLCSAFFPCPTKKCLRLKLGNYFPSQALVLSWQGLHLALHSGMDLEVVKEVWVNGSYDLSLLPGSVVLDVGMNVGITSLWLARLPAVAKVYGYEPIPALREQAEQQFALNPDLASKIEARPFGLAAASRQAKFSYAAEYGVYASEYFQSPAAQATQLEVSLGGIIGELTRITNLHPEAPLVMKLDGEGCEYELIAELAATGWLARIQLFMLEWHHRGPEELLPYFHQAGFLVVSRPADASRGMLYALAPGYSPLPLFEATQHAGY